MLLLKYGSRSLLLKCRNEARHCKTSCAVRNDVITVFILSHQSDKRTLDAPGMLTFFAFFDMKTKKMRAVLDNTNEEFLKVVC